MTTEEFRWQAVIMMSFDAPTPQRAAAKYDAFIKTFEAQGGIFEGGHVELYLSMSPEEREEYQALLQALEQTPYDSDGETS